MAKTKIEWTQSVWNPITGCTKVSAGCENCYAASIAKRFWGDRKFSDIQIHDRKLSEPADRKKPTTYFVNSMGDLFHQDVPFEWVDRVWAVMECSVQHTFQVLTKRPARMRSYFQSRPYLQELPNVWLGVTVESQKTAQQRIPMLLSEDVPSFYKFLSCEPLLSQVDLDAYLPDIKFQDFFWVIVGGETGSSARPCHLEFVRHLVNQCQSNHIPVFVKQLGARPMLNGEAFPQVKFEEWPEDLQVRQTPPNHLELLQEGA